MGLQEIVETAGNGIESIKVIADIRITRNSELYDVLSASIVVKGPGMMHMRIYKLGILVRDIVVRDEQLYVLSGKNDVRLGQFAGQLYRAIFWWEGLSDASMTRDRYRYVIRAENRELQVSRETLLPLLQEIRVQDRVIALMYNSPLEYDGFWYPSDITVNAEDFLFTVRVKKLIRNPVLAAADFLIPADINTPAN